MDKYIYNVISIDYFYKFSKYIDILVYANIRMFYIDFLKYDLYVFSRLFKNLRFNFFMPCSYRLVRRSVVRKNRRASVDLLKLVVGSLSSFNFWSLFERLFFSVFRNFFKYNMALYMSISNMLGVNLYNRLEFQWSDLYSRLNDLSDMITNRNNFMFKLDLPRVNYSLVVVFLSLFFNYEFILVFFSFFGMDLYLKRRKFKFVFYSRII